MSARRFARAHRAVRSAGAAWPFSEPKNLAVFTLGRLIKRGGEVMVVVHDRDGDWQFLDGDTTDDETPIVLALHEMVDHDPSLSQVACLPRGWRAMRSRRSGAWLVERIKGTRRSD